MEINFKSRARHDTFQMFPRLHKPQWSISNALDCDGRGRGKELRIEYGLNAGRGQPASHTQIENQTQKNALF